MGDKEIQEKLLVALDPNNEEYTIDDFNKEMSEEQPTDFGSIKVPLKFENKSTNPDTENKKNEDPTYAKDGDSGFDVRANLEGSVSLAPTRISARKDTIRTEYGEKSIVTDVELLHGETKVIPTGLFFEIPRGFEIQVRSRSGLSAKAQVVVTNSPGTVDSGYRGELKIILTNHGEKYFHINNGDRIAQCVFASVLDNRVVDLQNVNEIIKDTERGNDGFGSTGVD
jgi:dUTP pyrophosphatase